MTQKIRILRDMAVLATVILAVMMAAPIFI